MDLNAYPKLWQHQHKIMEADSVEEAFTSKLAFDCKERRGLFEVIMVLSIHGRDLQAYEFNHIISSPVKRLLKGSKDPYVALMRYRSTPLPWGDLSPAQLSTERIQTPIPQTSMLLLPNWADWMIYIRCE